MQGMRCKLYTYHTVLGRNLRQQLQPVGFSEGSISSVHAGAISHVHVLSDQTASCPRL